MNRSLFKFPTLLMLLLGFFLGGCATTNKNTKESTPANTSTTTNTSPSADTNTPDTSTSANTTPHPPDDTSASAATNVSATSTNASAANSGTTNNRQDSQGSSKGPVFKNGAPATYSITYSKEDPWEPVNRSIFTFNERVDDYLLRPVARGYKWIMPDPLQLAVANVFSNLNDIPVTVNNLLQLKFSNALTSSMRFVVNSTFGLAGLIDLASDMGLEKHDEDFGQTLGHHGIASGPYVVLPFLGPSSARDAGGRVLDIATDPVFVGSFFVAPFIGPIVGSSRATDARAGLLKSEKTLDEAALDKYQFVRDAYLQRRRSLVYDGNPPKRKDDEDD
ncbi:MAG: VacJ family lipoprotein [Nitrosospira sp.]|nr:VacJ family lipoprotein [Nitrosospira sp.]MDN5935445.1 VacJ family lipoprotein [Nitrosospira sp.]